MSDNYTVPRLFAAEILNVSVRTLDRYAKKDKISSTRRGRQLFFSEKELLDFKAKQLAQEQMEQVHKRRHRDEKTANNQHKHQTSGQRKNVQSSDFVEVEKAQQHEQSTEHGEVDGVFAEIKDSMLRRSPEESIYRGLYHKAEGEMKDLQKQLTVANYQVGKLEAQLNLMVPQLEYKKQQKALDTLQLEHKVTNEKVHHLESELKMERWVKRIYGAFLFIMTALMPLLLILRLFA